MKTGSSFHIFYIVVLLLGTFHIKAQSQDCPPPDNLLGNDTLICPDGALYLDAGTAVSYLWSDGTSESFLLVTEPGVYNVSIVEECDKTYRDPFRIEN